MVSIFEELTKSFDEIFVDDLQDASTFDLTKQNEEGTVEGARGPLKDQG